MSKLFWNALKLSPVVLGASLLLARASAAEASVAELVPQPATTSQTSSSLNPVAANTQLLAEIVPTISSPESISVVAAAPVTEAPQAIVADKSPSSFETQTKQDKQTPAANRDNTLPQVKQYSSDSISSQSQVTSVSQLSDVQPTDWAFQALQSLVERYGCIVGYPDGTYRGNRALTRYEFSAGLNACLDRVNELIATATADLVTKEDLATLQRLQEEFSAELATLRGRVDGLEARTAELEANQFSTTTKLQGEVIGAISDVFGDNIAVPSGSPQIDDDEDFNTIFTDRARLTFNTSFTGKDLLRTRLQARNTPAFSGSASNRFTNSAVTGTSMTRLGFDGDDGNAVTLDDLFYRFPLGDVATVQFDFTQAEFNDNVYTFNPAFESSGRGSISRFGRFNPIYRQGSGGPALTVNLNPSGPINLSFGYAAPGGSNPNNGFGLFNGSYAAFGQLAFRPNDVINLGVTYAYTYQNGGVNVLQGTGTAFANDPFGSNNVNGVNRDRATSSNHYAVEANFRLGSRLTIGGWGGITYSTAEDGAGADVNRGDRARGYNWAASLAFQDLLKEGSLLGVIFGEPPRVTANDFGSGAARTDRDVSYHLEGLYRYPINDNIDITPGVIVIFNPEGNDDNDTLFVGTIRTTFRF